MLVEIPWSIWIKKTWLSDAIMWSLIPISIPVIATTILAQHTLVPVRYSFSLSSMQVVCDIGSIGWGFPKMGVPQKTIILRYPHDSMTMEPPILSIDIRWMRAKSCRR